MSERRWNLNTGWLLIRIGIGLMFMLFGFGKITGGPAKWQQLGGAMAAVGITFLPTFWGFMAAFAEFFGGMALMLGILVRPFAALMCFTMVVAVTMLMRNGADLSKFGHALDMAIVFLGILIGGGGHLTLGAHIPRLKGRWWQ